MAAPEDEHLPRRLRALSWFTRGEQAVGRRWLSSLRTWMSGVRQSVLGPAESGTPPDASRVQQYGPLWGALMDERVMPEIRALFDTSYRVVVPDGDPSGDPRAVDYMAGVRNRLVRIPDEVYALIVRDIQRGVDEGLAVDAIAAAVQRTLTVTGSEYWAGRARTVARTETVGASNGGAFAAAVRRAVDEGDAEASKVWIATADQRTRDEHRQADRQQVPLLQPFDVGGAPLMFPGDPSGPAHLVINCRCSLLDVVGGEQLDWTNRQFRRGGPDD